MSEFWTAMKSSLLAIDSYFVIITIIANFVSILLLKTFRSLQINMRKLSSIKSLVKMQIVMKDDHENLYVLIRNDKLIIKASYNNKERTIIYSDLKQASYSEKSRVASLEETLAFNFAYSSIKKISKSDTKKNRLPKETDLIEKLLKKKAREATWTYRILILALCIEILFNSFVFNSQNTYVMIFTCVMIFLALTKQFILQFRVKKGLYGTCYSEAKEIISFISNDKTNHITGSKTSKLIFRDEEFERSSLKDLYEGERHVQRN